jgi:hypothetical protein
MQILRLPYFDSPVVVDNLSHEILSDDEGH